MLVDLVTLNSFFVVSFVELTTEVLALLYPLELILRNEARGLLTEGLPWTKLNASRIDERCSSPSFCGEFELESCPDALWTCLW